jgi:hypothetical protein
MLNRFNIKQSSAGEFGVPPLGGLESEPPEGGTLSYSKCWGLIAGLLSALLRCFLYASGINFLKRVSIL